VTAVKKTAREVKAVKISVTDGSLGLFFGVSVSNPTGASSLITAAHELYCYDHFRPLLTTSYA